MRVEEDEEPGSHQFLVVLVVLVVALRLEKQWLLVHMELLILNVVLDPRYENEGWSSQVVVVASEGIH